MKKTESELYAEWLGWLSEYQGKSRMVSMEEVGDLLKLRPAAKSYEIKCLPKLNKLIGGIRESDLVVVSGATKHGKTLLCLTLIDELEKQSRKSAFFSFEMPVDALLEKFGYAPPFCYTPFMRDIVIDYPRELREVRRCEWYTPKEFNSPMLEWVWVKVNELRAKGNSPDMIFIDHLHRLSDLNRQDFFMHINQLAIALKKMALDLRTSVICVAHTTKSAFDREPVIGDIRDSSMIAQEADTILMMFRTEAKAYVKVAASRWTGEMNRNVEIVKIGKFLREVVDERSIDKRVSGFFGSD